MTGCLAGNPCMKEPDNSEDKKKQRPNIFRNEDGTRRKAMTFSAAFPLIEDEGSGSPARLLRKRAEVSGAVSRLVAQSRRQRPWK